MTALPDLALLRLWQGDFRGALDLAAQAIEASAIVHRRPRPGGTGGRRLETAIAHVETLLLRRADGETWECAEPRLVLWSCHQVLAGAGDARAAALLEDAHAAVQSSAATIGDAALRASFLANVPHHRAIVDAWAAVA